MGYIRAGVGMHKSSAVGTAENTRRMPLRWSRIAQSAQLCDEKAPGV
jgi:hypothetical protein